MGIGPCEPPKYIPPENSGKDEKNKNNINTTHKLTQGNNLSTIRRSYLYKYEAEPNNKRAKLLID